MLVGRGGHSSNAAPLKGEYLVHMHPQLPHVSLVEMVTQLPYTFLERGCAFPFRKRQVCMGMV